MKRKNPDAHGLLWLGIVAVAAGLLLQRTQAATNVVVWDTGKPFADAVSAEHRANWTAVPSELFVLETAPAKAASDPGYYGREYEFQGDAVVENSRLAAVFWSARGRVVLYAKPDEAIAGGTADTKPGLGLGRQILELAPRQAPSPSARLHRCAVVRTSGDEVVLQVLFGVDPKAEVSAGFSFDKTEIVSIRPSEHMGGIQLFSPVAYGIVPSFGGDDLVFGPGQAGEASTLAVPAEGMLVGLLQGETGEWVMTWPPGRQQLQLRMAKSPQGQTVIESLDFANDRQGLYVAAWNAPGIWHQEKLTAAFLEKDVALAWKRPFPARWKTQLNESGVQATFTFRSAKGQIWRAVPGSYEYPVWFDGETAFYHLSKKVPPKGESIIYFLEGEDTPPTVSTPVDILKATLGRQLADSILDVAGRKLRTHHRRGNANVRRACTCGCTEAIQAVFEAGQETTRREDVEAALDDMNFFVRRHVERIEEYQRFAEDLIQLLHTQSAAAPERKSFCDALEEIGQRIPQQYAVQKENLKSLEYAGELTRQTMALTSQKSAENLKAYMKLLDAWRAMGGAQDYLVGYYHTTARELAQAAGYGCASDPKSVALAQEVRARCRQVLRNPDGYEIWADY